MSRESEQVSKMGLIGLTILKKKTGKKRRRHSKQNLNDSLLGVQVWLAISIQSDKDMSVYVEMLTLKTAKYTQKITLTVAKYICHLSKLLTETRHTLTLCACWKVQMTPRFTRARTHTHTHTHVMFATQMLL